jgi:hypothetical protein
MKQDSGEELPNCEELGGRATCGMYMRGGYNYVGPLLTMAIGVWDNGAVVRGSVGENGTSYYQRATIDPGVCREARKRMAAILERMTDRGTFGIDEGYTVLYCVTGSGAESAVLSGSGEHSGDANRRVQFATQWGELLECLEFAPTLPWAEYKGAITFK